MDTVVVKAESKDSKLCAILSIQGTQVQFTVLIIRCIINNKIQHASSTPWVKFLIRLPNQDGINAMKLFVSCSVFSFQWTEWRMTYPSALIKSFKLGFPTSKDFLGSLSPLDQYFSHMLLTENEIQALHWNNCYTLDTIQSTVKPSVIQSINERNIK